VLGEYMQDRVSNPGSRSSKDSRHEFVASRLFIEDKNRSISKRFNFSENVYITRSAK